jgi:glycosyltransferase involved in cell wall biosynthesis
LSTTINGASPLVTVVIPAFNAGDYLLPAVESILKQTYSNLEILLVDDGSTDDSVSKLARLDDERLTILRQANAGKSCAMNKAISLSKGSYIVVQDADDTSYSNRIEKMVAWMLAHPDIAMLFSCHDLMIDNKLVAPTFSTLSKEEARRAIGEFRMPGHDPTMMVKAAVAREFPFNPSFRIAEGLDFVLRAGEKYPCMRLGECVYSYRIISTSITKKNVARRKLFVRQVLRSAYARRGLSLPSYLETSNDEVAAQVVTKIDFDNNLPAHFMESVLDLKRVNRSIEALRVGLFCATLNLGSFHYHKAWIYSLLPLNLILSFRANKSLKVLR